MLKVCRYVPRLETNRLVLRELTADDTEDLRKWLGKDELYTYWGRAATKGEKNPELLFVDQRPNVNRKPSHDFIWGIELKDTHEIIGQIEIFDVENDRSGMVGYRIAPWLWNTGICTEAMRRVVECARQRAAGLPPAGPPAGGLGAPSSAVPPCGERLVLGRGALPETVRGLAKGHRIWYPGSGGDTRC